MYEDRTRLVWLRYCVTYQLSSFLERGERETHPWKDRTQVCHLDVLEIQVNFVERRDTNADLESLRAYTQVRSLHSPLQGTEHQHTEKHDPVQQR